MSSSSVGSFNNENNYYQWIKTGFKNIFGSFFSKENKNAGIKVEKVVSNKKIDIKENYTKIKKSAFQFKEHPLSKRIRRIETSVQKEPSLGLFLRTNEKNTQGAAKRLNEKKKTANSCHIGFSGWHNFDIIALRQSTYGIICDCNPANEILINRTIEILRLSKNRFDFVKKITPFIEEAELKYNFVPIDNGNLIAADDVKGELIREGSWLSENKKFEHIKMMALKDKISAKTVNILTTSIFTKIASLLRDNAIDIDTVYISNICNYMNTEERKKAFQTTLDKIIQLDTLIINCPENRFTSFSRSLEGPEQMVFTGKELKNNPNMYFVVNK